MALALLGVDVDGSSAATKAKGKGKGTSFFSMASSSKSSAAAAANSSRDPDAEYSFSRYRTQMRGLLEGVAANKLSGAGLEAPFDSASGGQAPAQSVRRTFGAQKVRAKYSGGRVIAFVLGGVSFAEVRCGYEVMAAQGKEVIVGGTSVLRPSEYVDELKLLV